MKQKIVPVFIAFTAIYALFPIGIRAQQEAQASPGVEGTRTAALAVWRDALADGVRSVELPPTVLGWHIPAFRGASSEVIAEQISHGALDRIILKIDPDLNRSVRAKDFFRDYNDIVQLKASGNSYREHRVYRSPLALISADLKEERKIATQRVGRLIARAISESTSRGDRLKIADALKISLREDHLWLDDKEQSLITSLVAALQLRSLNSEDLKKVVEDARQTARNLSGAVPADRPISGATSLLKPEMVKLRPAPKTQPDPE